jgi:hypothetical protein
MPLCYEATAQTRRGSWGQSLGSFSGRPVTYSVFRTNTIASREEVDAILQDLHTFLHQASRQPMQS